MSAISTVYDAMITRLAAVLTSHTRLSNPYQLEDNADVMLKKGYGVGMGPGTNAHRNLGNILSLDRTFELVLTRECLALEHDVDAIQTVEKNLMEDLRLVIRDFETNQNLNSGQTFFGYASDGGVEFVRTGEQKFLAIRAQFRQTYFENLNS